MNMAVYSSSPPPPAPKITHEVFLSFRGEDTRRGFISHLFKALSDRKIQTFKDDEEVEHGGDISAELRTAIEESRVYVVVFSKNYASSTWCLSELVHILECKERYDDRLVVPVFYDIDPSHVRKQEGSYGEDFAKHEIRFQDEKDKDKVRKWGKACSTAASLAGIHSKETKDDSELINKIIEDIDWKLNSKSTLSTVTDLVGIRDSIEEMKFLLEMDSSGVRVVCIWGMGGIGKTTLARALLSEISSKFEAWYFLAYDKDNKMDEKMYGPKHLKGIPLLEVLERDDVVRTKLLRTRVLIIVDDVKESSQLDFLEEQSHPFCSGSRIIITTRDRQLMGQVPHDIYKIKELNRDKALELFHLKAFGGNSASEGFTELSTRFVDYCDGIPLALRTLGSFLYNRNQTVWEGELNKLKKVPKPKIQNVLKLSCDGLDEMEMNMFLDIACFYNGIKRDYAQSLSDDYDRSTAEALIIVLIDKSLLSIIDNCLRMHDLLQEVGWAIARQHNNERGPGKRIRLWISEDVSNFLQNDPGADSDRVEGIVLNGFHTSGIRELPESRERRWLSLSPNVFYRMNKLKLLKIYELSAFSRIRYDVRLPERLHSLPDSLRYLTLDRFPFESLPSSFSPANLVELHMPNSKVVKLFSGTKNLRNLRKIDLRGARNLIEVPDLSGSCNIESIDLSFCESLVEVPSYFQNLEKLTSLDLYGCSKIGSPPETGSNMEFLSLFDTATEELPSVIWSLRNLEFYKFGPRTVKSHKRLPKNLCLPNSLKMHCSLRGCISLRMFPAELPRHITHLELSRTSIENVPASIECLSHLEILDLSDCPRLVSLPTNICKLKYLNSLVVCYCSKLECFPEISERMEHMELLVLDATAIKDLPSSIVNLTGLVELHISNCKSLESVPNSISKLENLEELLLKNCNSLQSLPELPLHLKLLNANNCTSLEEVSGSETPRTTPGWDEYKVLSRPEELKFSNCLKLDQNALSRRIDPHRRIISLATATSKLIESGEEIKEGIYGFPKFSMCFPGDEIPKWFTYQTEGSSIHFPEMKPLDWFRSSFLGFALCVVVAIPDADELDDVYRIANQRRWSLGLRCAIQVKTNDGDVLPKWYSKYSSYTLRLPMNSDHLLLWYEPPDYCFNVSQRKTLEDWVAISSDVIQASFDFYLMDEELPFFIRKPKVKKCGISLLDQDVREPKWEKGFIETKRRRPNDLNLMEVEVKKEKRK